MIMSKEQLHRLVDSLDFSEDSVEDELFDDAIIVAGVFVFKVIRLNDDGKNEVSIVSLHDDRCDFITRRGLLEEAIEMYQ